METISATISENLKRAPEQEGVFGSEAVREVLEAELERRRGERLVDRAGERHRELTERVDVGAVVDRVAADVPSSRESR